MSKHDMIIDDEGGSIQAKHDASHTLGNICEIAQMDVARSFGGMEVNRFIDRKNWEHAQSHPYRKLVISVRRASSQFRDGVVIEFEAVCESYAIKHGKNAGKKVAKQVRDYRIKDGKLWTKQAVNGKVDWYSYPLEKAKYQRDQKQGIKLSALLGDILKFLFGVESEVFSWHAVKARRDARRAQRNERNAAAKKAEVAPKTEKKPTPAPKTTAKKATAKSAPKPKEKPAPKKTAAKKAPAKPASKLALKVDANGMTSNGIKVTTKSKKANGTGKKPATRKPAARPTAS